MAQRSKRERIATTVRVLEDLLATGAWPNGEAIEPAELVTIRHSLAELREDLRILDRRARP